MPLTSLYVSSESGLSVTVHLSHISSRKCLLPLGHTQTFLSKSYTEVECFSKVLINPNSLWGFSQFHFQADLILGQLEARCFSKTPYSRPKTGHQYPGNMKEHNFGGVFVYVCLCVCVCATPLVA